VAGPSAPGLVGVLGDLAEAGGLGLVVAELAQDAPSEPPPDAAGLVRAGVHRAGPLPTAALDPFDILLSALRHPPAPWVGLGPAGLEPALAELQAVAGSQPVAMAVAAQVLRMTLSLSFDQSLVLESLAYSMLLASAPFRAWRAATPVRQRGDQDQPRVRIDRDEAQIFITLTRPAARNAVDARMRDALCEALEFALIDPDAAPVILTGEGPAFSAGGDLDEFGRADDVGRAHAIRTLRSATGLAHRLGPRLTARLHGACVGAGIEIPAAAGRVVARPDARLRLPEVAMGLIPGAGGTASIPRRIGRQRACYMAISGRAIDAETALDWGLVDEIDPEDRVS
jgi:enoyl-CoA hydratase/carnithine racemase